MVEEMERLVHKHSSFRQARAVGLFGCLDLVGPDGSIILEYHQPQTAKTQAFKKALFENGLWSFFCPPLLHCAPLLLISEEELRDGLVRLDRTLDTLDF